MQELELQNAAHLMPATLPMINYDAYNALDLSDRQQKELEQIRLDLSGDQERFFDEMRNAVPKPGKRPTPEEMKELTKKMEDLEKKGEALSNRIRARIVTILNREQSKRLQELQTNIPEFIQEKRKKMGMPPKPVDEVKYEKWKDSWKPGDPIPEEFRPVEKRKRGMFPSARRDKTSSQTPSQAP